MRRTVITLGLVGLFAACGFPDVTYTSGDDAGGDGKSNVDAPTTADGSSGDDAPVDATSTEGGDSSTTADTGTDAPLADADAMADSSGDATAVDSPSDAVDDRATDSGADAPGDALADVHEAAADAPPVCDFDMDTFKAEGATCGGNDCCDTDKMAHPGQTGFFTVLDACNSFDYNCNGTPDPQYPVNLTCGGTGLTGCTGGSAFLGNPACGTSALYGTCVPNGILACQPGNEMTVQQGCN